jgi:hypothetical protein
MMKFIRRDHIPDHGRPLGYWITGIGGPLRETMRDAFATFGVTPREWRTLDALHEGPATVADVEALRPPRGQRPARPDRHIHPERPKRERRTIEQLLDGFVSRGWASLDRGSYALTAEGERIHAAVLANVRTLRMDAAGPRRHGRARGSVPHCGHQLKRGLA